MGYVDKAVTDLISRAQVGNFKTRDGTKIADLTHADTAEYTKTTTELGLPANTVALLVLATRIAGTGKFRVFTKSSGAEMKIVHTEAGIWPIDDTGVFRYAMQVNNDDWDIFCFGYWVVGRILG